MILDENFSTSFAGILNGIREHFSFKSAYFIFQEKVGFSEKSLKGQNAVGYKYLSFNNLDSLNAFNNIMNGYLKASSDRMDPRILKCSSNWFLNSIPSVNPQP
jgi:hypothetical protein